MPWYATWLLPLAIIAWNRAAIFFSLVVCTAFCHGAGSGIALGAGCGVRGASRHDVVGDLTQTYERPRA
jgi:hypothetical protein